MKIFSLNQPPLLVELKQQNQTLKQSKNSIETDLLQQKQKFEMNNQKEEHLIARRNELTHDKQDLEFSRTQFKLD